MPNLKAEQFAENDKPDTQRPRDFGDECLLDTTVCGEGWAVCSKRAAEVAGSKVGQWRWMVLHKK